MSEGFAFQAWYLHAFGPHVPTMFNGIAVRFTPVSALIQWRMLSLK
jgi:hypothetical protein